MNKKIDHLGAAFALAFGLAASQASAGTAGLDVQLSTPGQMFKGTQDVPVTVTVTNNGAAPVRLLKWALPGAKAEGSMFVVKRDGQSVPYLGALYKRAAPTADDYVTLAPGEKVSAAVELSALFDLSQGGHYAISYKAVSAQLVAPAAPAGSTSKTVSPSFGSISSGALDVWMEASATPQAEAPMAACVAGGGITYLQCSSSRQGALITAVKSAYSMASNAQSYLSKMTGATTRYTTWWGSYSSAGRDQLKEHYANEITALTTKRLQFDCTCTEQNVYAYVYPSSPYRIYLCGAFWAAPNTGTDSRAGTLIHELSHFTVVAGTDDYAYGQDAAQSLAISNPTRARMNADSHEYFAENTPALP
ncbi:M35 family metallo-endopeptidase [Derxia gummosa]|uniref:M35 family metallo-endopeptidase n=1 Tax=Derxia gummosa DSM 723 TaxID=1121388 RepID=A0A8B6X8U9_9BURK|nr:M35 family metallo-endopeptidase [Derxia gummosa]